MNSKGERIKTDQITICAPFDRQWNTFSSSLLTTVTAVANCELRGVFGTGEREGGRYVTGIAGCLQVVLGGFGKGGGEWKGNY